MNETPNRDFAGSRRPGSPRMVDPEVALQWVVRAATQRPPRRLALVDSCGLQLAQDVHADGDYPPFDRAAMDGYAVSVADAGRFVPVVGEVAAGQPPSRRRVIPGACVAIMTGAACPAGTEAVVPKEETTGGGDRVQLPGEIQPGQYLARAGSECRRGQQVLRAGETITPLTVAVLASFGVESVEVIPRPRLAIITTGAELVPVGEEPRAGKIRDSNGPMLSAMAADLGIEPAGHVHVGDRLEDIAAAIERFGDEDVVLLTGGVSAGRYDLVPDAVRRLGAEIVFHKVTQKPGKPLLVAAKGPRMIFGLPGNPLSCHFCFHRYVAAAIRRMAGKPPGAEVYQGRLAEPVAPKPERTYFVPARAEGEESGGTVWSVRPLPGLSSADMFGTCLANCYLELPPGETAFHAGHAVRFTWIGGAPWHR